MNSKPQLSLIKSKIVSQIKSKLMTSKTTDTDDQAHGGTLDGLARNKVVCLWLS